MGAALFRAPEPGRPPADPDAARSGTAASKTPEGDPEAATTARQKSGGDIDLTIFPGVGHVMASTSDGAFVFDLLDSFRS